ncbi:MAG: hypothetical protein AB7E24_00435 [Novosphingobium sp.]
MAIGMSPRQAELLRFIQGHIAAKGKAPTFVEMCAGIGAPNKSTVARLLDCLEARGRIRRGPGRPRAIAVLEPLAIPRAPDGAPLFSVPFREAC